MLRSTQLLTLLVSLLLLTGCGVKGGLTMPPADPPSVDVETSEE